MLYNSINSNDLGVSQIMQKYNIVICLEMITSIHGGQFQVDGTTNQHVGHWLSLDTNAICELLECCMHNNTKRRSIY